MMWLIWDGSSEILSFKVFYQECVTCITQTELCEGGIDNREFTTCVEKNAY